MHITTSILILSSLGLFGCTATHINQPSSPVDYHTHADLHADIDIGEKIEGKATAHQILWFINWGANKFADGVSFDADSNGGLKNTFNSSYFDSFAFVKSAAAYAAVSDVGADVIVAPRYEIEILDYFVYKTTTAKVTGYRGTIKKFSNTQVFDFSNIIR